MPESAIQNWFLEASSNNQEPPISTPENGTQGEQYPSVLREHMAAMRARDEASSGELQGAFAVLEEWSLTIPEPITELTEGLRVAFRVPAATAQVAPYVTLAVNGFDAAPLRYANGGWPTPNSFLAGQLIEAIYTGGEWRIISSVDDAPARISIVNAETTAAGGVRTFNRFDPGALLYTTTLGVILTFVWPATTDPWWPVDVPVTLFIGPGMIVSIETPFGEGTIETTIVNTLNNVGSVIEIWKRASYQYDVLVVA